jgi:AcrR family transcriptional regulator
MGIRERQAREREARRLAILEAARQLFVSEGYRRVSIRNIARRVEVSPAAIYGYFPSKDDIFFALAEEGFRLFSRAMTAGRRPSHPLDALRQRILRYYEFAREEHEYFALMFLDRSVPRIRRDWERFSFMRETGEEMAALVEACVAADALPAGTSPTAVFHVLAAAIHGAAVIRLSERFCRPDEADVLARDTVEVALAGLRSGVRLRFSPSVSHLPEPCRGRAGARRPPRRARAGHPSKETR